MEDPKPWPKKWGRPMLPSEMKAKLKKEQAAEKEKERLKEARLRWRTRVENQRERHRKIRQERARMLPYRMCENLDHADQLIKEMGWTNESFSVRKSS